MRSVRRGLLVAVAGVLSGIALVFAGVAGGQQPTPPAPSASALGPGSFWGEALVDSTAGQLVGGDGLAAARAARRAGPEAVAARAASRDEFHGRSPEQVRAVTAGTFPQLIAADGGVPALPAGERIEGYPTDHSAEVSTPSGP